MRHVLYAEDMEPITVIELSSIAKKYLDERSFVRLAVMLPPKFAFVSEYEKPTNDSHLQIVNIYSESFIRNGIRHSMLFTKDEESAMLLKSAFLPGQHNEVNRREQDAFAKGFLYALEKACGV